LGWGAVFSLGRRTRDDVRGEAAPRPRRIREKLRLSPNEERYLLAESLTNQVYAAPSATRLLGPMDPESLIDAVKATCDRHEARRCGFERGQDGRFTKYVEDRATVVVKRLEMPGATEAELCAVVRAYCFTPSDFTPETLHRFIMIKVGENDHVFGFSLHHATSDGVTTMAFAAEVHARRMGFPIPDTRPAQYGDFWDYDWEQSDAYREAEAFWLDRLGGLESDVGVWPADRASAELDESRLSVTVPIPAEIAAATKAAADRIGITHFNFFYAAYVVLLARMTGKPMVCTTFQSAGRRGKEGAQATHGVFSNALILASRVDEAESIADLAARHRVDVREAIAHEIFPYHHVIRSTGFHARYAINWLNPMTMSTFAGDIEIRSLNLHENQDDDDLNLRFATVDGELRLTIYYKATAFGPDRVRRVGENLIALAGELARDIHRPVGEIRSVDLAPPGRLPDPTAPLPQGGAELIHARFLARAAETPDAPALVHAGRTVTYGQLEQRSRAFAQRLRAAGVVAGDRVAILADRGPQLVWSMLAVARLGGIFVVLDAADPEARLARLMAICAPKALVHAGAGASRRIAERLAAERGAAIFDAVVDDAADAGAEGLDAARPAAPAYFLFTSGSTGQPRCVAASHQPLVHFVDWQIRTFGLRPEDRFTLLSGLSHDPLLRDIFTPLSLGAALLIPDPQAVADPRGLAPWLREVRATVAHLTPPMGQVLAAGASQAHDLPDLRHVFWGGDELRPALAQEIGRLAPGAAQTNFYGSTETPQAAGFFRLDGDPSWKSVPLGKGSDGFQLLVVDERKRPVGEGELGEIAVRSNYLSLGYVEAGRVLPATDRGRAGDADIYYTGDRGFYLPDGSVMFAGRGDDQVKVRGHRVDMSEITAALQAAPGVRSAIALAVGEDEAVRIVAFVAGGRGRAVTEAELRTLIAARLPSYMVPHTIRLLAELPLLPNGKVDRRALLALAETEEAPAPPPPSRATATERALMAAWSKVLNVDIATPEASFASLGGDSLSYVQAYLATEEIIGEAPVGWHLMSLTELAAVKPAPTSAWSTIDMPVLMRAVTVILVVATHFALFGAGAAGLVANYTTTAAARAGGGATGALMLISGFMFANLALQQAFKLESARPAFRNLWSIFIPTAALSAVIVALRMRGAPPDPYIYLLTADFQDFTRLAASHRGADSYLWYVHALLHILAILYLSVLVVKAGGWFDLGRRRFLLILFGLACLGRFVLPIFLDDQFLARHADAFGLVAVLPTTHLATFVLGGLIAASVSRSEKLQAAVILVAYAVASAYFYGQGRAGFILIGGLLLLALPRVRLPRAAAPTAFALAGASLWIYLSHTLVRDALALIGLRGPPVLILVIALAAGVGFWTLWSRGIGLINRHLRRPLVLQPDAAV
jgi:amino acid adenylation domain-containing protein